MQRSQQQSVVKYDKTIRYATENYETIFKHYSYTLKKVSDLDKS